MKPAHISKPMWAAVIGALIAGTFLRTIWVADMEYKYDEQYMYERAVNADVTEPWPSLGMRSGVELRNPPLSVWLFIAMAKISRASSPTALCRDVQLINSASLCLLLFFIVEFLAPGEREPWLWGLMLAAVNPLGIIYQRKIWAQSVLPFFCVLFVIAWWRRERHGYAFSWGLIGALLPQIHMSGFLFNAAVVVWSAMFERGKPAWRYWFAGSCIGAIPLIGWLGYAARYFAGSHAPVVTLMKVDPLRFWLFWLSDPVGLHVGHSLLGWKTTGARQLADFAPYPFIAGHPTYLMLAAHLILASLGVLIYARAIVFLCRDRSRMFALISGRTSQTTFIEAAELIAFGLLMTLLLGSVARFYLIITYPLEYVWLAGIVLATWSGRYQPWSRIILAALVSTQLTVSACFLEYIHVNGGAPQGDYGIAYRLQLKDTDGTFKNPLAVPNTPGK